MARYIDADKLKQLRDDVISGKIVVETESDLIDMCPTADVAEVKYGEWIDKPTGAYRRMQSWCSACGKHSGIGGIESNRHKPYCPNCGAKMDGGNDG